MAKNLFKILLRIVGRSVGLTFILALIIERFRQDFYRDYIPLFTEVMMAFIVLLISLSVASIFLNLNQKIRSHPFLRFLSFFLLPTLVMVWLIIKFELEEAPKKYLLAIILPFYIVAFREFYLFSKKIPLQPS